MFISFKPYNYTLREGFAVPVLWVNSVFPLASMFDLHQQVVYCFFFNHLPIWAEVRVSKSVFGWEGSQAGAKLQHADGTAGCV